MLVQFFMYVHQVCTALTVARRSTRSSESEAINVYKLPYTWVLDTDPEPFARATSVFNFWAMSSVRNCIIFNWINRHYPNCFPIPDLFLLSLEENIIIAVRWNPVTLDPPSSTWMKTHVSTIASLITPLLYDWLLQTTKTNVILSTIFFLMKALVLYARFPKGRNSWKLLLVQHNARYPHMTTIFPLQGSCVSPSIDMYPLCRFWNSVLHRAEFKGVLHTCSGCVLLWQTRWPEATQKIQFSACKL